jgi:hypothetical protein
LTYEDFREWALDTSRTAALRWEEPDDDESQILLAVDDYGAHHGIPVPPFYLNLERGHLYWLRTLPHIASNRSLKQVAYRTSAWSSTNPNYVDQPVDDPDRQEVLMLHIAEKSRYEVWTAPIRRSASGLPRLDDWTLHASDPDGLGGALPKHIRAALESRQSQRGPTMPAADLVLGPWDVPEDFLPVAEVCGPLDQARDRALSSFVALYRPESPGPVILSQVLTYPPGDAPKDHVVGSMRALNETGHSELDGPSLGDESHYFGGDAAGQDGSRLDRYTAMWRYPGVFCELMIGGPPGRYTKAHLLEYASAQDQRARAALEGTRGSLEHT